jgi:2',3'-cyclic-nucleotide 2'-phosphodiesterase (5'-nucleotidase family)
VAFLTRTLLILALAAPLAADVVVLHTNDTHGQLFPTPAPDDRGGLARRATLVARERAAAAARGDAVLLVDAGDVNTGTLVSDEHRGRLDAEAMTAMGYDAAAVGNHEFDLRPEELDAFVAAAGFPFLSANVRHRYRRRFPAYVVKEVAGERVALVGLTTTETPSTSTYGRTYGCSFTDPVEEMGRLLPRLEAEASFVVLLSHLGSHDDARLLEAFPGRIHAIVAGHTHAPALQESGGTLYSRTGAKGRNLGRFRLTRLDGRPVATDGQHLPVDASVPADPTMEALLPDPENAEVVATASHPIERGSLGAHGSSSPLGNFYCDALRDLTGAQVGVANRGGLRTRLEAGPVTAASLHAVCPFPNEAWVYEVTGRQLERVFHQCRELGCSGSGFLEVSGATVRATGTDLEVHVEGAPLHAERTYTLAVSDFVAQGGDGYTIFSGFGPPSRVHHESPAEMLVRYARKVGALAPIREPRVDLPGATY